MLRVKLFTHTDLDGAGCSVVARRAFMTKKFGFLDVTYCDYNQINQKIEEFINQGGHIQFDAIFITDISVNEEVAQKLNDVAGHKLKLIDHHETAVWLNEKYSWATVIPSEYNEKEKRYQLTSGTSLFYEILVKNNLLKPDIRLAEFCEIVRQYDSYEWKDVYNNVYPKLMNDLYYLIGRYEFIKRFSSNPNPLFTREEKLLLEIEQKRIDYYIKEKEKSMIKKTMEVDGKIYNVGMVFSDRYQSELGNYLCENHPDLDFSMMIDLGRNRVSLRGVRDDLDLGQISKQINNGGGHKKAAGFVLPKDFPFKVLDMLENLPE